MKKLSFILILAGTISIANAQETFASLDENSSENKKATVLNEAYLAAVQEKAAPRDAKYLEGIVSQWDATKSTKFDSRRDPFKVMFNSNRGNVEVIFDRDGQVMSSKETYNKVSLPLQLKKVVYHRYTDWKVIDTKYKVSYEKDQDVSRTYFITLEKDGNEKRIKIDGDQLL